MAGSKLNPRHEIFIQGILEGKSQTRAYIDAGYKPKNARKAASNLWTNIDIQGEVKRRTEEVTEQARIHLKEKSLNAAKTITDLAEDGTKDDFCKLQAAKDVLDRTGLKVAEKLEHSGKVDGEFTFRIIGIDPNSFPEQDDE